MNHAGNLEGIPDESDSTGLGSGLIDQSQKMTAAAMQMLT